jgi:uncharacterized protein YbjQ (UPF0145 family)
MIITNTEIVPGYQVMEIRGLVQGNTIRAKHLGRDIAASLKNLVGGELRGYTELLTEARRQSLERMMAQAQQLGANAIINVRFTTSAITQGAAELYAYGTAVTIERVEAETPPTDVDGAAMFRRENLPDSSQVAGGGAA